MAGVETSTIGLQVGKPMDSVLLTPAASPSYAAGKLVFDSDNDSLTFFNSDSGVGMQVGQEFWLRAKNVTGSTIGNGVPVYISGSDGSLPTIAPAAGNADPNAYTVGLTTESIADTVTGFVTTQGIVHGLDTSGFSNGAILYAHPTSAGVLTSTAPTFPYFKSRVGVVARSHATLGQIFVNPSTTTQRMISVRNPLIFTKSDTTLADVTGLSVNVLPGVHAFEAVLQLSASAIGGYKLAIGGTATATALLARIVANNVLTAVLNSAVTALGSAVGAVAGTDIFVRIFGTVVVSVAGTLTIQFAQNVASGASSVLANSAFQVQVVAN